MYVEVSIPISLFKTFTYKVPAHFKDKIFPGQSIVIPFNNQYINGFIIEIKSKTDYKRKLLNIYKINSNCFFISKELWKTVNWISKYYICPIGKVLNQTLSYQHIISSKITLNNLKGLLSEIQSNHNTKIDLNNEQKIIYKKLFNNWESTPSKPALLSGVTSSGKTILYIAILESYLKRNKDIIILVPEVSLIPQIYSILSSFYKNKVGIWHAKMRQTEKKYILNRIKKDNIKIIISTQSGIFIPFNNLGLIVVDEEHDFSYKQERIAPYYQTRDVALMRGKFSNSNVLLVSSVPSIETYYNVKRNKYFNYVINNRFYNNSPPKVHLIDMTINKGPLSDILIRKIKNTLDKQQQIILLQNRKGIEKVGIEKVESILYKLFPEIKVLKYDKNSISKSDNYYKILNDFKNKEADLLLGTQMIAKGIEFDNVSLVGIINADIGLMIPDYKSGEKIFQLIYQFIGRSGSKIKNTIAIIQSSNTENLDIKNACKNKLNTNLDRIMKEREELSYPPYSRLIKILFLGLSKNLVKKKAEEFSQILIKNKDISVLGPSIAPIEQEQKYWRYQILLKCKKTYWQNFYLWLTKNFSLSEFENTNKKVRIKIDVDNISIL